MLVAFLAVALHAWSYAFGNTIAKKKRGRNSWQRTTFYVGLALLCGVSAGQAVYLDSTPAFAELTCVLMVALETLQMLHEIFSSLPLSPFMPYGSLFSCLIVACWPAGRAVLALWLLPGVPPHRDWDCRAWSLSGRFFLSPLPDGGEVVCDLPLVGRVSAAQAVLYAMLIVILGTTVALATWAARVSTFSGSMKALGKMLTSQWKVAAFAVANAVTEEFEFRGINQQALQFSAGTPLDVYLFGAPGQGGSALSLIPLQSDRFAGLEVTEWVAWVGVAANSLLFGLMHYYGGFPDGKMGYLMVFVWGSILCVLRWFTGSMLPSLIIHIWADMLIGQLLVYYRGRKRKAVARRKP